ncbi:unnamed protein product, partial [Prorocentrum cordatum]
GTGLFSLPREHGSSAQGGHFLAHRGRAACLLREWERRAEGAGAGAGTAPRAECRVSRAQRKGDAGGASNTVRRSAGTGGGGGQGG